MASVLQELEQLRSLLRPGSGGSPSFSGGGGGATRRALAAADEEVCAALDRTSEAQRAQLRRKEVEAAELQRSLDAARRDQEALREALRNAKRKGEHEAARLESALGARSAEAAQLHAEVLALRAERDDLRARGAAAAEEASQAALAAARERREKELLALEVVELRRELEGLEGELGAASARAQEACGARRELARALDKATALHAAKDVEIAELARRLRAEHGVRKACERWLRGELKSRQEEMGELLQAVRGAALRGDPAGPAASTDRELEEVQRLLAALGQQGGAGSSGRSPGECGSVGKHRGAGTGGSPGKEAAGQLRGGRSRSAERQAGEEFAHFKAGLGGSARLKQELAEALLRAKAALAE
ncbi:hypothetical protein HT031_001807 [Scenedesmus sp. PABB004]|nr:hypothetical protein HT031_001807 [Scenedesmus sp. PABB004]